MEYTKEQLEKAAQELNSLGFEPKIEFMNDNIDQRYLEAVIAGRVYSLISEGFVRNRALAINVFIDLMKKDLSEETLLLIRHLLENCNVREVEKGKIFEVFSNPLLESGSN